MVCICVKNNIMQLKRRALRIVLYASVILFTVYFKTVFGCHPEVLFVSHYSFRNVMSVISTFVVPEICCFLASWGQYESTGAVQNP
jgi:hypothetical protein